MNQPPSNIPFYHQMVSLLRNAFDLIDEQGQHEVFQFVISQQNAYGGFKDRGGRSDLYYSLFGLMLLKGSPQNAAKLDLTGDSGEILRLRQFIVSQSNSKIPGFIEQCCLALLQKELKISRVSRVRTLLKINSLFWRERHSINLSYRSFVMFLTLDAVLPFRGLLQRFSGKMLSRVEVNEQSPCSEIAAKVFLLNMLGKDGSAEQQLLFSFASETGGFLAFQHLDHADMLSTAVALFALQSAGCDLRLLTPGCLSFIQQNFADGAFLSGDGDPTADLEYTFYGLLALGTLPD
jgi:hypothetical protein